MQLFPFASYYILMLCLLYKRYYVAYLFVPPWFLNPFAT